PRLADIRAGHRILANLEPVHPGPGAVRRPVRPAQREVRGPRLDPVLAARHEPVEGAAERAALADLAERGGGDPIAVAAAAVAIFEPAGQAPALAPVGGARGDRGETLGELAVGEEAAAGDRLQRVEHARGVRRVQRPVAVESEVERPVRAGDDRLGEAPGGEGPRTIFADLLAVRAERDMGAGPGAKI